MLHRHHLTLSPLVLALFGSAPASALDFTFLTHPDLVGRISSDAYLGNADDLHSTGLNSIGAASQFAATNTSFGFLAGAFTVQGVTPFGLQERQYVGTSTHTSANTFGEWNSNFTQQYFQGFTQTLNGGSASSIVHAPDQSYTTAFVFDDSAYDGRIEIRGEGRYLRAAQDPADRYSGDLLTHFATVLPLLPTGWAGVAQENQTWTVLDGPQAGVTGFTTATFYTFDPAALPDEATPVALGPPWQTVGYVSASSPSADLIQIGSPHAPAIAGTALLTDGASASISTVTLGGAGHGALIVQGPGTALGTGGTFGSVTIGSPAGGSLSVLDGASMVSDQIVHFVTGRFELLVDGVGSRLLLTPYADDPAASFAGLVDVGSTASGSLSTTTVSNGGHLDLLAIGNTTTTLNLFGNHAVSVDGVGSRLRVEGTQSGSSAALVTGVIAEQTSSISVTNGATLEVIRANAGTGGIGLGVQLDPNPSVAAAQLLVDGPGSRVDAGSALSVGQRFIFDADSNTFVDAGRAGGNSILVVSNGGVVSADRILIGAAGTLHGNAGTLVGLVENHGVVDVGESPGSMTINGDFIQGDDGLLVIELGGTEPGINFDVLTVNGKVQLGGTLEIILVNDFMPTAEDSFNFLRTEQVLGSFSHFILPTLANGQTLALHFGAEGISAGAAPVPLPPAASLFFGAVAALVAVRRHSRA